MQEDSARLASDPAPLTQPQSGPQSGPPPQLEKSAQPRSLGRGEKSPEAFRIISEVAQEIGEKPHVLRFWETKFPQVKPVKRAGGRRYYRPEDVEMLKKIKQLVRDHQYKIEGAQKFLKTQSRSPTVTHEGSNSALNIEPLRTSAEAIEEKLAQVNKILADKNISSAEVQGLVNDLTMIRDELKK